MVYADHYAVYGMMRARARALTLLFNEPKLNGDGEGAGVLCRISLSRSLL